MCNLADKLGNALHMAIVTHDAPYWGLQLEENRETLAIVEPNLSIEMIKRLNGCDDLPLLISADWRPVFHLVDPVRDARIVGAPPAVTAEVAHFATQALAGSADEQRLDRLSATFGAQGSRWERLATIVGQLEAHAERVDVQPQPQPPPELPMLRGLYEEIERVILVMPNAAAIQEVDWAEVGEIFGRKYPTQLITTTTLLPLLIRHDFAVPFAIDRFRHTWGHHPAVDVPLQSLLANAAHAVFTLASRTLPHAVIRTPESEFGNLVHHVQNQLLKVQFQFDLLSMIYPLPDLKPPRLPADRTLPNRDRILNIQHHLRAWIALYRELLQTVPK